MKLLLLDLKQLNDVVDKEAVKKDAHDKLVKTFNAIQTSDTSNLVKKTGNDTTISKTEKKITDHDDNNKYITTQKFNKLYSENFAARLKQANLATKADITDFLEQTNFDDKLKNLNKKATSNKTISLEAEKKLTDLTKNYRNIRKRI